jgi:thiazole synthase
MVYISDAPSMVQELESRDCGSIIFLGSLIGAELEILNSQMLSIIKESAKVQLLVDKGGDNPRDAAIAMERGCDGVRIITRLHPQKILTPYMNDICAEKTVQAGKGFSG